MKKKAYDRAFNLQERLKKEIYSFHMYIILVYDGYFQCFWRDKNGPR